jgi:hypothetical protein
MDAHFRFIAAHQRRVQGVGAIVSETCAKEMDCRVKPGMLHVHIPTKPVATIAFYKTAARIDDATPITQI